MSKSESLFIKLATVIDSHITEGRRLSKERAIEHPLPERKKFAWLPTPGNVLFTLAVIVALLWAQSAGAIPFAAQSTASTGSIAYQGRLANAGGTPLTQIIGMEFRLYNAATGGATLWTEQWTGSNSVQVSDGLFNVMLGSLTSIPQSVIAGNSNLFLGITVGTDDEMSPRVQLGSVLFAVQALTVSDESITTAKIANGAITLPKLSGTTDWTDLSITTGFISPPHSDWQKAQYRQIADIVYLRGLVTINSASVSNDSSFDHFWASFRNSACTTTSSASVMRRYNMQIAPKTVIALNFALSHLAMPSSPKI